MVADTQEYTFLHSSRHCRPLAGPVSVVFGAEGERCLRNKQRQGDLLYFVFTCVFEDILH